MKIEGASVVLALAFFCFFSACLCETTFLALLQDECREFRDLFKKGKLSCTRENDPVRDSSGKQHSNKCIMCAEKL
uniref:Kazal-like domain-containing protein n=1 Tax=Anas platyrhynchos platyrhynchos TaxID=8840 RepID=A0A493TFN8_ANAPP